MVHGQRGHAFLRVERLRRGTRKLEGAGLMGGLVSMVNHGAFVACLGLIMLFLVCVAAAHTCMYCCTRFSVFGWSNERKW